MASLNRHFVILGVLMFLYTFFIPVHSEGVNAYEVTFDFHSGALWGTFSDHEISANTMYCATVLGLAVVDVTDPSNPQELSVLYFGDIGQARAIGVSGDYVYLLIGTRFQVIDVGDPSKPKAIGHTAVSTTGSDILATPDFAFVGGDTDSLFVVNVSDPSEPTYAGSCGLPYRRGKMALAGGYLFIPGGWSGMHIVDVSQSDSPVLVNTYNPFERYEINGVKVRDSLAFTAYEKWDSAGTEQIEQGLGVLDASDPQLLENLAECPVQDAGFNVYEATDVDLQGDYAFLIAQTYVSFRRESIYLFDVSDPGSPVELDDVLTEGSGAHALVASETSIFVRTDGAIEVLDTLDWDDLHNVGTYAHWVNDLEISGDYCFVSDGAVGMYVMDLSDPSNPAVVSSTEDFRFTPHIMKLQGDFAYFAEDGGVRSVDISNPLAPVEADFLDSPVPVKDIDVQDCYACIATNIYGIKIIDISDPYDLSYFSAYVPDGWPGIQSVAWYGSHIVAGLPFGKLHLVDVSDPSQPSFVASLSLGAPASNITVLGNLAFASLDGVYDLAVIDLSDPENPSRVATLTDTYWGDIVTFDPIALAPLLDGGVNAVDMFYPFAPQIIGGYFDASSSAYAVAKAGEYVYVAAGSGLEILTMSESDLLVGDADDSGLIDLDDVVFLLEHIFSIGPAPVPGRVGDVDCSGAIDIDDIAYLVLYLFAGGPEPCNG